VTLFGFEGSLNIALASDASETNLQVGVSRNTHAHGVQLNPPMVQR